MPVRTARLAHGQTGAAGSTSTIYTCPPGKTGIVKDVRVTSSSATPQTVVLGVVSGPTTVWVLSHDFSASLVPIQTTGFLVLEPGDHLVISAAAAAGATFHISGAELEGVAP